MYNNFGINIVNIFKGAEEEMFKLKHPYVGTEHLLLSILKNDEEMIEYFNNYNLNYDIFYNELIKIIGNSSKESKFILYTPLLKRVISSSIENAKENNNGIVTSKHLITSLLEEGEGIAIRLLIGMNIDLDNMYEELNKSNKINNKVKTIYEIGNLLNDRINDNEVVVGRDKEIQLIIETLLRKKKNNPILIGDAGVGKTAIIEELTRRIIKKEVPEELFDKKIISLEMGSLVGGTKYRGEFEERLTKIIKELENSDDIILFIDEIHSMVTAGGAEGAITAGDIFKPALARGNIKCIGATTKEEYNKHFKKDKALMRRFEVINIEEPSKNEVKDILLKVKNEYEKYHNIIIPNKIIDKILYYTDNFIFDKKSPDKAIDFLDSICTKIKTNNNKKNDNSILYKKLELLKKEKELSIKNNNYDKALDIYNEELLIKNKINNNKLNNKLIVKEKDIINTVEDKTNIILSKNKLSFLNKLSTKEFDEIKELIIENVINKRVFLKVYVEGNNKDTNKLIDDIKSIYPRCNYIKIDLKEYTNSADINKLIGTQPGFVGYNDSYIFSNINNCFSIIVFNNYRYANNNIKELIKKILNNKYINDNKGEKIYFNNSYIFIIDDISNDKCIGFNKNEKSNKNELDDLVDKKIIIREYNLK